MEGNDMEQKKDLEICGWPIYSIYLQCSDTSRFFNRTAFKEKT
jgi:hypothetical protein